MRDEFERAFYSGVFDADTEELRKLRRGDRYEGSHTLNKCWEMWQKAAEGYGSES